MFRYSPFSGQLIIVNEEILPRGTPGWEGWWGHLKPPPESREESGRRARQRRAGQQQPNPEVAGLLSGPAGQVEPSVTSQRRSRLKKLLGISRARAPERAPAGNHPKPEVEPTQPVSDQPAGEPDLNPNEIARRPGGESFLRDVARMAQTAMSKRLLPSPSVTWRGIFDARQRAKERARSGETTAPETEQPQQGPTGSRQPAGLLPEPNPRMQELAARLRTGSRSVVEIQKPGLTPPPGWRGPRSGGRRPVG